ncbi:MAG: mannonate dehydratase [Planctomycetes bacterium]|nr:mannonate dehydratase [Planctomycetota bacterium]
MKIGLGLYRRMFTPENLRFARQAGCTHVVAHLVDYFREGTLHGTDGERCWGITDGDHRPWSEAELLRLRDMAAEEGLQLEAIENFDPGHWHDVLLDGPKKDQQIEHLKAIVRRLGRVGIRTMGYNFSIAGVWGHVTGPFARGGAESVGFLGPAGPAETPIPNGQVWNMTHAPNALPGTLAPITSEQLWDRVRYFLEALVPVAEAAGVRLAAHPDDPPMPTLRGTPRLVYQPHLYQRLLDLVPSPANALEFCLGSLQEMTEGDVYEAVDRYSRLGALAYVHFRNVQGKVPDYREVFIDEGDLDMIRALRILHRNGYDGLLVPDHAPLMSCDAPWHAGMAYTLGYIRAVLRMVESPPK